MSSTSVRTCSRVSPSACVLFEGDGAELLMHIGIDTVKLGGKHFTYLVNEGDKVRKGQPLIRFELEAIKAEGYPVTTPLIVCNTDDYAAVAAKASGIVKQGDALLELKH